MKRPWTVAAVATIVAAAGLVAALSGVARKAPAAAALQFIFTADAHYGITRTSFRGASRADAHAVNAALMGAGVQLRPLSAV